MFYSLKVNDTINTIIIANKKVYLYSFFPPFNYLVNPQIPAITRATSIAQTIVKNIKSPPYHISLLFKSSMLVSTSTVHTLLL